MSLVITLHLVRVRVRVRLKVGLKSRLNCKKKSVFFMHADAQKSVRRQRHNAIVKSEYSTSVD